MSRFIKGEPRAQSTLFPERVDEYIAEDNPVRVVEAFVNELNLYELGFTSAQSKATDRPAYHPSTMLKLYIYGYHRIGRFGVGVDQCSLVLFSVIMASCVY